MFIVINDKYVFLKDSIFLSETIFSIFTEYERLERKSKSESLLEPFFHLFLVFHLSVCLSLFSFKLSKRNIETLFDPLLSLFTVCVQQSGTFKAHSLISHKVTVFHHEAVFQGFKRFVFGSLC